MTAAAPVRKRLWTGDKVDPQDVGELARGVDDKFGDQPTFKVVEFRAQYAEPMWVAFATNPAGGILCTRVRIQASQDAPVLSGAAVHWLWDDPRGAKVLSIDGLTPGATQYIFTFMGIFLPQVVR